MRAEGVELLDTARSRNHRQNDIEQLGPHELEQMLMTNGANSKRKQAERTLLELNAGAKDEYATGSSDSCR